jgi:hypothetical protein
MHRLRFLLVLAFAVVLGTSLAGSQDGTGTFNNQDKQGDHNRTQDKTKTKTTSNDNHRKHWWSPPHWFHKKHDNAASTSQTGQSPFNKTGAGDNASTKNPENKTVAAASVPKTSSTKQAVTGARPTTKTVAVAGPAGKGTAQNIQSRKTTATAGAKKTTRHDCTPEQAKKTGCVVDKGSSQKTAAKPS